MFNIRELRAKGFSRRAIARITGMDRKTVRKYIDAQEAPRYKPRPPRVSKLEPYVSQLRDRIREGMLNCSVLLEGIRAQGYSGGKSILKEFVAKYRAPRAPQAVQRFETKPGQQAQADWGVFRYEDPDGTAHTVYAFVFLLSFSRVQYIEFVERMDLDTLLRCLLNAFEAVGGVPETVLFDNMKQVVLGRDEAGQPEWHPRMADFAALVGFRLAVCRPRRPQTKGRVERLVRYIRQNFWPGRRFTGREDLNHQASAWCDKANRRVHGTTKAVPVEMVAQERLSQLPERRRVEHLLGEERKVSRDAFVSWDGSRYGVPWQVAGSQVLVKDCGPHIEIWTAAGDHCIGKHPKSLLPGATVRIPGQYDKIPLGGEPLPAGLARRVPEPDVQVRSLVRYDAVAGGLAR